MALSWSMDKLGPICRTVEDCAIVFDAIYGPDNVDASVMYDVGFAWDATLDPKKLRIGYTKEDFEHKPPQTEEKPEQKALRLDYKKFDEAALEAIQKKMGINLIEVELPKLPFQAMRPILIAEAAAAFDELTRSGVPFDPVVQAYLVFQAEMVRIWETEHGDATCVGPAPRFPRREGAPDRRRLRRLFRRRRLHPAG